jgi:hypothetical protein
MYCVTVSDTAIQFRLQSGSDAKIIIRIPPPLRSKPLPLRGTDQPAECTKFSTRV